MKTLCAAILLAVAVPSFAHTDEHVCLTADDGTLVCPDKPVFKFEPVQLDTQVFDKDGNAVNLASNGTAEAVKEEAQTESVFLKLMGVLITLLVTIVLPLAKAWRDKILAEKDQTKLSTGMGIALSLFDAFVTEASRELLPKLKEALADGILSEAERADLRKALLGLITSKLPGNVLSILSASFGPGLQSWLEHQADSAIDRAAKDAVVPR